MADAREVPREPTREMYDAMAKAFYDEGTPHAVWCAGYHAAPVPAPAERALGAVHAYSGDGADCADCGLLQAHPIHWTAGDDLRRRIHALEKALRGVIREADRNTDAFIYARGLLAAPAAEPVAQPGERTCPKCNGASDDADDGRCEAYMRTRPLRRCSLPARFFVYKSMGVVSRYCGHHARFYLAQREPINASPKAGDSTPRDQQDAGSDAGNSA